MTEPPSYPQEPEPISAEAIEAQLAKIIRSKQFLNSERLKDFLAFVVKQHFDGNADQLKETTVALSVFGKKPDFDPAKSAIVRTTANRLRKELENYYETEGSVDSIRIELPVGHYAPRFTNRKESNAGTSEDPAHVLSAGVRRRRQIILAISLGLAVVLCVVIWLLLPSQRHSQTSSQMATRARRVFASSTSEGQSPIRIHTGKIHETLLITRDGKKLYTFSVGKPSVTVFGMEDLETSRTFDLPFPPYAAFMPEGGTRLYFSAFTPAERVMVLDTVTDRIVDLIPTGSPAFGLVVTPDEKKLFVALGRQGVKRIDLATRENRFLSALASPFYLAIDPARRRLYISYQGGGPGGTWGHDAVAIYDIDSEHSVGAIADLPLVGGPLSLSQGGDALLLDGKDACSSPDYDHIGCPQVPSHVFHLWHTSARRVVFPIPMRIEGAAFLPHGSRILLLNGRLAVWDWARQTVLESVKTDGTSFQSVAISPGGDRIILSFWGVPGLVAFEAERPECLQPSEGLANFYSGDGTTDDAEGIYSLRSASSPSFVPGRIGQAFRLNGSFLQAVGNSGFCTFCGFAWTESFFVKLSSLDGEMTIHERVPSGGSARRLYKAENNHFVYEGDAGAESRLSISSANRVETGRWYHVAIVNNNDRVSFYLDGKLQGKQTIRPAVGSQIESVLLGASQGGRHLLNGLIDEIAVYNRELTPAELTRVSRPCSTLNGSGS